jgi:Uncharacterized protein conserved in bacteria
MKRFLLCIAILLSCFSGFFSYAQGNSKTNRSLLWRISGKQMSQPSYLFGTIHIICADDYIWTPAMQNSFDKTNELCLEMDMDDPNLPMDVAKGMINTSGKQLSEYFTPEDYAVLEQYVKDTLGMGLSGFQQIKPVGIFTILTTKMASCPEPVSYEARLMELAHKNAREVTGLETAEEQLDLLDNLPADSIVKSIMQTIKGDTSQDESLTTLTNAYKQQDLAKLYELIKESKDIDLGGFLDTRNEKWIPRMIQKMDQRSVFFAVGAGHLWGEAGVIYLLRKEGYTVEPVK